MTDSKGNFFYLTKNNNNNNLKKLKYYNDLKAYRRNVSLVVPQCINELAMTVAVWHTEFLEASCKKKNNKAHREGLSGVFNSQKKWHKLGNFAGLQ